MHEYIKTIHCNHTHFQVVFLTPTIVHVVCVGCGGGIKKKVFIVLYKSAIASQHWCLSLVVSIFCEINRPDCRPLCWGLRLNGGWGGGRKSGGLGANSCPNILHADLYSLHPCCYWYHYAGCSCCEEGPGTGNGEVMELQALTRSDTGSRSAKHLPDFNGSRTFPVSALDQRSLPANQNTWT